jgi:hypothetical protein
MVIGLQVQQGAATAFGPILERAAKAERIKGVLALMRRFQGLFAMPQRITSTAAAQDYEQVGGCMECLCSMVGSAGKCFWNWLLCSSRGLITKVAEAVREAIAEVDMELLLKLLEHMVICAAALSLRTVHAPRRNQFAATFTATLCLLQVIAEYKKAVGLIRPGPHTAKVWVSLFQEIDKVGAGREGGVGRSSFQGSFWVLPESWGS